ncbi:hypothetical protein THAOC_12128 [Thalassiosira oceanica]|uniref:Uncharacterized protein n=1 Tax=Thalassiosira oceanica TaxID=159749 RepID=K0T0U4_THAOC|nr:hypothetical protein THAOC_12128 [Thalassiosira oceanica]|eukprot:EJK66901.1 hypothetical protein THAOC_12128 [Thalassiosira oceanica]
MLVHPSAVNSLVLVGSLGLGSAAAPKGRIRERRLLQKKDLLSPSGGAPPFNEKNRRGDGRPGRREEIRAKIAELKSESSTEEIPAVDTGVIGHEADAAPVASKLDVGFVDCFDGFVRDDFLGVTCEDACDGNCCVGYLACNFFRGRVAKDGSCNDIPAKMRSPHRSPTRRASESKLAGPLTPKGKGSTSPMGPVRDIMRAIMSGSSVSLDLPSPRHALEIIRAITLVFFSAAWATLWVRTCQSVAAGSYQSVSAIVDCCNAPDGFCAGVESNDGLVAADPTCKAGVNLADTLALIEEESESDTSPFTEKQLCYGKTAVENTVASLSKGHSTAAVRYGVNKAFDDLGCDDKSDSEISRPFRETTRHRTAAWNLVVEIFLGRPSAPNPGTGGTTGRLRSPTHMPSKPTSKPGGNRPTGCLAKTM